jgi:hypothetical protein
LGLILFWYTNKLMVVWVLKVEHERPTAVFHT